MPDLFSFVDGYCLANDEVTVETAALACATLTPGIRRPWMSTHSFLRSVPAVPKTRITFERKKDGDLSVHS